MILTPLSTENPNDHTEQVSAALGQLRARLPRGVGGVPQGCLSNDTSDRSRDFPAVPRVPRISHAFFLVRAAHFTEEETESRVRWTGRGLWRVEVRPES